MSERLGKIEAYTTVENSANRKIMSALDELQRKLTPISPSELARCICQELVKGGLSIVGSSSDDDHHHKG